MKVNRLSEPVVSLRVQVSGLSSPSCCRAWVGTEKRKSLLEPPPPELTGSARAEPMRVLRTSGERLRKVWRRKASSTTMWRL